jgi:hypothetical protein
MKALSPLATHVAVVLGLAACAASEPPADGTSAAVGRSEIARDYLGSGAPSRPAVDPGERREMNGVERWIADHLPWFPSGLER